MMDKTEISSTNEGDNNFGSILNETVVDTAKKEVKKDETKKQKIKSKFDDEDEEQEEQYEVPDDTEETKEKSAQHLTYQGINEHDYNKINNR